MKNGYAVYQETAVTTQSKGKLVVMLYDGAIKFLKQAIIAIENEDFQTKNNLIIKAQDIILELNAVLDMEAGGEIAENLRKLYVYVGRRLAEANVKNDISVINEVIKLLDELNQAWRAIAE